MDVALFSWCDFLAGWAAGICGILIGHPLDTVKVRQQLFSNSRVLHIILQTYKHEGIFGFYKGTFFPLLAAGALNSIFFGVYGTCLRGLEKYDVQNQSNKPDTDKEKKFHVSNVFLAGIAGGIATVPLGCPVDLIKIKMQSQTGDWKTHQKRNIPGPVTIMLRILKTNGVKGFFHGYQTMLCRDSVSSGIYIFYYTKMLSMADENESSFLYEKSEHNVLAVLIAGGIAGVLSWASIMPLDVVKTRIQADDSSRPEFKGMVDCIVKSYKKDGISVFGRGFIMCSLRSFPVNAATFLGYEMCLKYCKLINGSYC